MFSLLLLSGFLVERQQVQVVQQAKTVKQTKMQQRKVYLTFDDGPSVYTEQILDILEKEQVKATFFLIGNQITGENEQILKNK